MSSVVDKRVQITGDRAKRLARLAAARGTTESALIEEGLDLLFREQERQAAREEALREGRELLQQMEADMGPLPSGRARVKIHPEDIVSIVGTPIDPATIRRTGD